MLILFMFSEVDEVISEAIESSMKDPDQSNKLTTDDRLARLENVQSFFDFGWIVGARSESFQCSGTLSRGIIFVA